MSATHWYPSGYNSYPVSPYYSKGASLRAATPSGHAGSPRRAPPPPLNLAAACAYPSPSRSDHRAPTGQIFNQQPDLVDGIDYFKIGESVRIRRYRTRTDEYSPWLTGKVERPILVPDTSGGTQRSYAVSFTDPRNGRIEEKLFSPFLNEITNLAPVPVNLIRVPKHRVRAPESHVPSTRSKMSNESIVFALIPSSTQSWGPQPRMVWTPALVLTPPSAKSIRVRVLAGPEANKEVSSVKYTLPYNPQIAADYKKQGHDVEGDGKQKFMF